MRLVTLSVLAVLLVGTTGADAGSRACLRVPKDSAPAWSPDGRLLAFVRHGGSCTAGSAVYVIGVGGAGLRRVATGGGDHPPSWSPDGTRLAFPSSGWLTVMSLRGRGLDQLARGGDATAWSPDGRRIAFTRGRELRVVDADGANERLLAPALASGARPGWSRAGAELLYGGSDGDIHVVDADSGANRVVASDPSWDSDPVWGAHGGIGFVSARTGSAQMWTFNDGRLRQETFGPDTTHSPAVSREGFYWAFVRRGSREPGLHYWPPAARRHYRLGEDVVVAGPPAFSPSGRFLAWTTPSMCGRWGVHVYGPLQTGEEERRLSNRCAFKGTSGRDTMHGTPFGDLIEAGAGDDVILTRDGRRDSVRCGPGRDRVVADRKDAVGGDCEHVERP